MNSAEALVLAEPQAAQGMTPVPAEMMESLRETMEASMSMATRQVYRDDWARFEAWCAEHQLCPIPASGAVVAAYCDWRGKVAGHKYAYIERGLSAISFYHRALDFGSPRKTAEVDRVMRGLRRLLGTKQRQATPLVVERLRQVIASIAGDHPTQLRDRALLLTMFLGAFRISEALAIQVEHLGFSEQGLWIDVPKSKTNQEGRDDGRAIPFCKEEQLCAVRAVRAWIDRSAITGGPLFRSMRYTHVQDKAMHHAWTNRRIQQLCREAGLNVAPALLFSSHCLRAGLATEGFLRRVAAKSIMNQTGHRSQNTMHRYIREAGRWRNNVVTEMGL